MKGLSELERECRKTHHSQRKRQIQGAVWLGSPSSAGGTWGCRLTSSVLPASSGPQHGKSLQTAQQICVELATRHSASVLCYFTYNMKIELKFLFQSKALSAEMCSYPQQWEALRTLGI